MKNKMAPVHPGEILQQEMEEIGISARSLSSKLGVPTNRITGILNQKRRLSPDTALRLARYFGTSPEFWLNLQQAYDLKVTQEAKGAEIARDVEPLNANT
jgi:addiction module HigA family antidote